LWFIGIGYFCHHSKIIQVPEPIVSIPAFIIIAPFIQMFPIGWVKILYGSAILTVLTFFIAPYFW
jgi:hypothetical protein